MALKGKGRVRTIRVYGCLTEGETIHPTSAAHRIKRDKPRFSSADTRCRQSAEAARSSQRAHRGERLHHPQWVYLCFVGIAFFNFHGKLIPGNLGLPRSRRLVRSGRDEWLGRGFGPESGAIEGGGQPHPHPNLPLEGEGVGARDVCFGSFEGRGDVSRLNFFANQVCFRGSQKCKGRLSTASAAS